MYKTTADRQHDISRTGSHATKPLATGRVDVLPPNADPWAAIFNDLQAQRRIALDNLAVVQAQIDDNNYAIRMSSDAKEQRGLLLRKEALSSRHHAVHAQLGELRHELCYAARSSMGERFRVAARAMLLDEQYAAIKQSAQDITDDPEFAKWARRNPDRNHTDNLSQLNREMLKANGPDPERLQAARDKERQREKLKNLRRRLLTNRPIRL